MLAKRLTINILRRKFSSVDDQEISRFQRLADEWYKRDGKYSLLHKMNPVRVGYLKTTLAQFQQNEESSPLANLKIADIGCGGGFLAHPLSRLGAEVCGVDATLENIEVAKAHKDSSEIEFIHSTAEELVEQGRLFDAVCALEIIEHVNDPREFVETCSKLLKPNGFLFLSTINRNALSYIGTIAIAENVLGWVPKGTHQLEKYVKPEELSEYCTAANLNVLDVSGMNLNPFTQKWSLAEGKSCLDLAMNFIMTARKPLS